MIGLRIRKRREELGLSQEELAKRLGYRSRSTINKIEAGVNDITQSKVVHFANALDTTIAYLMGWADETDVKTSDSYPTPETTEDIVTFPVIGEIAAGYDHIAYEDWSGDTVDIPLSYLKGRPREDYLVLRVIGSSMFPMYQDGDTVLILKQSTLNRSGEIGAVLYDDYATLKKVEYVDGEDWMRLIPINPTFEPQLIEGADLERCRILGIPKYLIREID